MIVLLVIFASANAAIARADDRIPPQIIRLPESLATVFVAETRTSTLHRVDQVDGELVYVGNHYMSIGKAGSGKEKNGDKKTPLGVYFVTEELDTTRLHEKYGPVAYPLDYPNIWDQAKGRSGDGIWVHGVDRRGGKRPAFDTDGCIALPNEDLIALSERFEDNITPVVILEMINWGDATDTTAIRGELEERVALWSSTVGSGDLHSYLSLYDDAFGRWGLSRSAWSALQLSAFNERNIDDVRMSELLLLSYPQENGLYLSRFEQTLVNGERTTQQTKRLYWRRDAAGELKIVAEDDG